MGIYNHCGFHTCDSQAAPAEHLMTQVPKGSLLQVERIVPISFKIQVLARGRVPTHQVIISRSSGIRAVCCKIQLAEGLQSRKYKNIGGENWKGP